MITLRGGDDRVVRRFQLIGGFGYAGGMSIQPVRLHCYTLEQYFALEEMSVVKHEFLDGEIYARAGGTPEHAALSAAVIATLAAQLQGGPCRVYSSDLRVRVLATGLATYPDASVVGGSSERDEVSRTTVVNPRVIIEVLSDSTENYDRGEKLEHYKRIPSLQAVVHVSHRERTLVVHERQGTTWAARAFGEGDIAEVASIGCRINVGELYGIAAEPGVRP